VEYSAATSPCPFRTEPHALRKQRKPREETSRTKGPGISVGKGDANRDRGGPAAHGHPPTEASDVDIGSIRCRSWLGGLLKYYI
jgi:hypothetical protein